MVFLKDRIFSYSLTRHTVIGRNTLLSFVDIDISVPFVSRKHGEIYFGQNGLCYVDANSTNGTYVNGKKLSPLKAHYLSNGDVLHIFNGTPSSSNDFVCMIFSTDYPEQFETGYIGIADDMDEISIGRQATTNFQMENPLLSENHASFFRARLGWAVTDHNSTNGVYVNNCRLETAEYLKIGDCVRITNIHFIYTGFGFVYQKAYNNTVDFSKPDDVKENPPLEIHIVERSVWHRAKKLMLLQNINMTINAGEMVLILGGSGAGKTTFMNAVMGYEKAEGKILHGDTNIYEAFESMKYKIGFVPQQDLLRGSDTVYDTLENAAEMKMSVSKQNQKERIEQVLETLGLQRERKSLVSKLSGGQRKRLSIAVEYIANPSLFFLDEPDSGLDGIMAKSLMQNLRMIADEGKIVMIISHAPDRTLDLFDKVIVLAKSTKDNCGHLAFFGTVQEAKEFFEAQSLEEVVKRVNRPDEGGDGQSDYYIEKYNQQA